MLKVGAFGVVEGCHDRFRGDQVWIRMQLSTRWLDSGWSGVDEGSWYAGVCCFLVGRKLQLFMRPFKNIPM